MVLAAVSLVVSRWSPIRKKFDFCAPPRGRLGDNVADANVLPSTTTPICDTRVLPIKTKGRYEDARRGLNPKNETLGKGTLCRERKLQVAKKRVGRYPNEFRRKAVERLKSCENIVALSQELGVHRRLLYKWRDQLDPVEPREESPPQSPRESTL